MEDSKQKQWPDYANEVENQLMSVQLCSISCRHVDCVTSKPNHNRNCSYNENEGCSLPPSKRKERRRKRREAEEKDSQGRPSGFILTKIENYRKQFKKRPKAISRACCEHEVDNRLLELILHLGRKEETIVSNPDERDYRLLSPWQAMSITTVLARMSTSSSPCEICTP
jgi:hypothetical protein